ncbi:MAG: hypothetical protein MJ161_02425 [Clostridia bacterium]|nr:hypothetical protein [Clostridia bacterium]
MKYYEIEQISNTGLARAIYTTADNPGLMLCTWRRQNPVKTSMLTAIILNR